ncbi:glucokinase [Sandaracinobacter sp. RS1-74]|uniref:glucokinase n=1 Tax=Sandaracinobacteroides sayramensis TaxID=2913411 RepID=UPI001EDC09B1|nr:glucokinase [Sandaracinobacteroides sayramensis]MCG2840360.1 glucokinase [Sandaracinobacteroides sayramensis]
MEMVAADIGGTHARFAIATRGEEGRIALSHVAKLKVAEYASLQAAFEAYRAGLGRPVPDDAVVALAAPTNVELITLANSPWSIRPALVAGQIGLKSARFINDFSAVSHAISECSSDLLEAVAGPRKALPAEGAVTVVGPGTGLGVGLLLTGRHPRVVPTEGGHIDFAPVDHLEERILAQLRRRFGRVSVERLVSGPGLSNIHAALAAIEGRASSSLDDKALWTAALENADALAREAFDRWCLMLGSVTGDLALAQGADAVVLAGGMLPRVRHLLAGSGFHARFKAKGRFEKRMADIPILHIVHPEPGLLGAAAVFFNEALGREER